MPASERPPQQDDERRQALLRAAFRDLHADRLHGFALLVTVGDRPRAAALLADALHAGAERADELRHPERAAAWLRQRVLAAAGATRSRAGSSINDRRHALDLLGVEPAVQAALSGLSLRERAAVVADVVEGLDPRDVAVILGRDGIALSRELAQARRRYLAAYAAASGNGPIPDGPIVARIHDTARRALA